MKICVLQAKSTKGDIQGNVANHIRLVNMAVANEASMIFFPELSMTGYEPSLAKALATNVNDNRFDKFQELANTRQITIGIGMPINNDTGVSIGMIIFQPDKPRQLYSKKYIHPDEEPFFIHGQNTFNIIHGNIAPAICYELSVAQHSEDAFKNGAKIYIATVAKTAKGVNKAIETLAGIANKYSMPVLLSNCVGLADGEECGGKTSAWNNKGMLLAQLNNTNEGLLIMDTDTQEITEIQLS